mgnify:CR=1 FL=1
MSEVKAISALKGDASAGIQAAESLASLDEMRVRILGKKGTLTELMKSVGGMAPEERKEFGAAVNEAKRELEQAIEQKREALELAATGERIQSEWIDVTLPVTPMTPVLGNGTQHPLTTVQRDLERIFNGLGFAVVDGPEVETEHYNFTALNVPDTHPARDMQDTFWTAGGRLLRTHTSAMQVRTMERIKPPFRIVAPGRCFRYERIDATHEHTFYQMDGMMVDKNVSVGHLIYFMKTLLREIFGKEQTIRLRPGYFPFVEPGFELDIWFKGRWLELLPCGLVHPRVLEYGGIDPKEYQGFAFGLGLSRLVMSRFQIDDIRHMQAGDLRFQQQFC